MKLARTVVLVVLAAGLVLGWGIGRCSAPGIPDDGRAAALADSLEDAYATLDSLRTVGERQDSALAVAAARSAADSVALAGARVRVRPIPEGPGDGPADGPRGPQAGAGGPIDTVVVPEDAERVYAVPAPVYRYVVTLERQVGSLRAERDAENAKRITAELEATAARNAAALERQLRVQAERALERVKADARRDRWSWGAIGGGLGAVLALLAVVVI